MNCRKVAVFVSGEGTNLQAIIDASAQNLVPVDISLVVCNNPNANAISKGS